MGIKSKASFNQSIMALSKKVSEKQPDDRPLDRTDRAILRTLQTDGRMQNNELAAVVNLSPTACLERVRRLTREGVIRGYHAELDPRRLDAGLLAFVEIKLDRTTTDVFERFRDAVHAQPEILECHLVAGGFDYLIKIRARDLETYRVLMSKIVWGLPGVRETHTYAVMEEVKNTHEIFVAG
jgi:Lrp/AsnC family transcriptional regulator, leucine-responsive regulatory protein